MLSFPSIKPSSSIPKKFHRHIEDMHKEPGLEIANGGVGYVVYVQGLSDVSGAHGIFERNLKDVVGQLKNMTKCDCDDCVEWWNKQE